MTRWVPRLAGSLLLLLGCVGLAWADAPHHEYDTQTKTATGTGSSTDATLWDPAAGKRFILFGCVIAMDSAGTFELEVSDVDVIPPIKFQSTGRIQVWGGAWPIYVSATDAVLTYTVAPTNGSSTWSVMC